MQNVRLSLAALLLPVGLMGLSYPDAARADLSLDPAFGTNGVAVVDISTGSDKMRALAVQADGALVLSGWSVQTVGDQTAVYVAVIRQDATTGALDPGFGTGGIATFLPGLAAANNGGGDGRALAIQPLDQKIIVAGRWDANEGAGGELFVARLDTTGALDPTFGTAGVVLFTPPGVTQPQANGVALRSDGGIIVVGTATASGASVGFVVGLTSTGALDPAYASAVVPNPLATGTNFRFNDVAILPGDAVLAAGGGGDLVLARFTSAGDLDTAFDGDGIASFNYRESEGVSSPVPSFDMATAVTVGSDGKILVSGLSADNASSAAIRRVMARVTATGALDTSYGSGGFAPLGLSTTSPPFRLNTFQDSNRGLGIRPSGDSVLAGADFDPTQVSPAGISLASVVGVPALITDLAVLDDGNGSVVVAGESDLSDTNKAFVTARLIATDLADGPDTVPDPISFTTQRNLELEATATSNAVTISGINAPAPISVSNGQYSIGCSVYTTAAATVSNGQTVCLKGTASPANLTLKTISLAVGGVTGAFTIVTGDATPDQFTFVDQTDVTPSTEVISAPITLQGMTIRNNVSISAGGGYSVGCTGTFVAGTTLVDPGAQICVRLTSSPSPGAVSSTVLTVGNVSDTFSATTIGDITPDQFTFADQTGVARSTVITSAPVTLTGFLSASPITVSNGTYSIGCTGSYTAASGTVNPNATVCVRHTSSSTGGTVTNTTLSVGAGPGLTTVSDVFSSTTEGVPDDMPDAFSFPPQTNAPLAAEITSGTITITGTDTGARATITGGTYSVNCGPSFTSNPSTFAPNTRVCVRHKSPPTGGTQTSTILTVGGVSGTFTSTTLPGDAVPNAFSFADQTGVALYTNITSAPLTISGIDIPSPVTVTGGEYSIGCTSTFTTAQSNISSGQTICVRHRSSIDGNATVNTTLTIGTESDTFTTTTGMADQLPDDFSFTDQTNVALSTVITSNTITISGVDAPVIVRATGSVGSNGSPLFGFSVGCTGSFDAANSGEIVDPGETLCAGLFSADTDAATVYVTITIGGTDAGSQKSATFLATTGRTVPDAFTFTDQVGVLLNATVYALPITITGITAPSRVEVSNGQWQLNCTGSFTSSPGVVSNGETICVRHIASGSLSSPTDTELTVGGISDTFSSTTVVEKPLPGGSAMDAWSLLVLLPFLGYRRRLVGAPSGATLSSRA